MTIKFSQFEPGLIPRTTDVIVGLRNGLNERFDFSGVADSSGANLVTWMAGPGPNVNYLNIENNVTGQPVIIGAIGTDNIVSMLFIAKGNGNYVFAGTGALGLPSGTAIQAPTGFLGGLRYNTTAHQPFYWDDSSLAWVPITQGSAADDATFITQTDDTAELPNSIPLSGLASGFLSNTTGTGVLNPRSMIAVASSRILITNGNGVAGNTTFDLATTSVAPGTYNTANITVDAYGRLTFAANGTDIAIGVGQTIVQTSHGFTLGEVVYYNGSAYALAKANSTITAEVIGVIEQVVDANTFVFISVGLITGLSGLTPGVVGWLSDATAGLVTQTIPTTPGNITKPVWIAISATSAMVYQERGKIIPNPAFQAFGFVTAATSVTVVSATGYITDGTGTITYTLPSAAAQEDYYIISGGSNTTGWKVQLPAGATLKIGNQTTTAGGTLSSTLPNDSVNIVCVGTSAFQAYGGIIGNPVTA